MNNTARPPMTSMPAGGMGAAPPPQEPTTRERIARYKALARRGLAHWKMALLVFIVAAGLGVGVATQVKRSYLSECTVVVKAGIRTDDRDDMPSSERATRAAAKLKDMLMTRALLEDAIKKFQLYPKTVDGKGMLDAVDEMKLHVGFRARQGGTFVVAFDSAEVPGGKTQDLVRDVTQYLAEQLIDAYSNTSLTDLRTSVNFFDQQAKQSEEEVERATTAVTVFLSKHPEFSMTLQPGQQNNPIGLSAGQLKLPKGPGGVADPRPQPKLDPALLAIYQADPALRVLYLQRAKVEDDIRASQQQQAPPTPAPTSSGATAALAEQITAATAEVDAAQKRVADTQADVLTKSASLAPEHPDMKAAQTAAAAATARLQQAKAKLAQLQAQRAANAGGGANPYDIPGTSPELLAKLKDINSQIGQREADLKKTMGSTPPPVVSAGGSSSTTAPATTIPAEPVSPLVALETEWQRLLRDLASAKDRLELRKKDYERASMAVRAAQAASNEVMSVVEPAYRPTHPFKGGRTPAAMAGIAIALVLAILYMASRVVFNDTIIDAADIEALKLIPVLGVVPKIDVPPPPTGKAAAPMPKGGAPGVA